MRTARMMFSMLAAAATISLSSGVPTVHAATPVPVTAIARVDAPWTTSVVRTQSVQRLTALEMDATVGGWFGWARDFVEGMVVGIATAAVLIAIVAIAL